MDNSKKVSSGFAPSAAGKDSGGLREPTRADESEFGPFQSDPATTGLPARGPKCMTRGGGFVGEPSGCSIQKNLDNPAGMAGNGKGPNPEFRYSCRPFFIKCAGD